MQPDTTTQEQTMQQIHEAKDSTRGVSKEFIETCLEGFSSAQTSQENSKSK